MPDFLNIQIPAPKNWQDFEDLCADLWSEEWNTHAEKHGRSGQKQKGVDIYGQKNGDGDWVAVQCKGKNSIYGKGVTPKELKDEVANALGFNFPLKEFILATSADADVHIQELAREITEEHKQKGLFSVKVIPWPEIQRLLNKYPHLLERHYPDLSPAVSRIEQKIDQIAESARMDDESAQRLERMEKMMEEMHARGAMLPLGQIGSDTSDKSVPAAEQAINNQIDDYRELLRDKQPKTARRLLEKLKATSWNDVSDWLKFRITTNIAAANLTLGNEEAAAEQFLEAKQYAPDDEKALGNETLAYIIQKNYEKAREAATNVIALFPDSPNAHSLLISLKSVLGESIDIESIPKEVLETKEVLYALASYYAKQRNLEEHIHWVDKAYRKHGDDTDIQNMYAISLLEQITNDKAYVIGGQKAPEKEEQLEEAVSILHDLWDVIQDTEIAEQHIYIAENLITAERLRDNHDEALTIANGVLAKYHDAYRIAFQKALILVESGDICSAKEILANLAEYGHEEAILLHAELLIKYEEYDDANALLEKSLASNAIVEYLDLAKGLNLECIAHTRGWDAFEKYAKELAGEYSESILLHITLSRLYAYFDKPDLSEEILKQTEELVSESTSYRDLLLLADTLFDNRLYSRAATIYEKLIQSNKDSVVMRRYLSSLYEADRRQDLIEVIDRLSDECKSTSFFKRLIAATHIKTGSLELAKKEAEEYIKENPKDLNVIVHWAKTLFRLRQPDKVKEFLEDKFDFPEASIKDREALVSIFDAVGLYDKALELAYSLLLENPNSREANLGYILLMLTGAASRQLPSIESVAEGTAVTVRNAEGNVYTQAIDDDWAEKDPVSAKSVKHEFSQAALGKKVGDEFEYQSDPFHNEHVTIINIQSKHAELLKETIHEFPHKFPEETSFYAINLGKAEDSAEPDIAPILKTVDERHAYVSSIVDMYRQQPITIGMVSQLLGRHPMEVWRGFQEDSRQTIHASSGIPAERHEALNLQRTNTEGYVVDPLTLYGIYESGLGDDIVHASGGLYTTRSSIEMINELIDDYRRYIEEGGRHEFTKTGDGVALHDVSKEQLEYVVAHLFEFVEWVQGNCTELAAVGSSLSPEVANNLAEMMDPSFMDCLYAANGSGKPLLSDDIRLRSIATGLFNVEGVWTQIVLIDAKQRKIIDGDKYALGVIYLLKCGYSFTTIDKDLLQNRSYVTHTDVNEDFKIVASSLGKKDVDLSTAINVANEFLASHWKSTGNTTRVENYTYAILHAITRGYTHPNSALIIEQIMYGNRYLPPKLLHAYIFIILQWLDGHFVPYEE